MDIGEFLEAGDKVKIKYSRDKGKTFEVETLDGETQGRTGQETLHLHRRVFPCIYLSIPYTGMEESSFLQANEALSILLESEVYNVYSPITHSHPAALGMVKKKGVGFLETH